jgi:hypothetical protein
MPNLVRLIFLGLVLAFFFGSMISLWGTEYQWLAVVIGAFLLASIVSLFFFRWKTIAFFTLGFLISNFSGAYIASQQLDIREARSAYVSVAGRTPAYAVLFPDALQAWLADFSAGSQGGNSISDRPDFNGRKRFVSRVDTERYDPSNVYFLATSDLDMTDREFVDSYRNIAQKHGDWLGYMARCVHYVDGHAPLLPQNKRTLEESERTKRLICGLSHSKRAFGIDIEAASAAYLSKLGITRCEETSACINVKTSLKSYGDTFFPE